MIVHSVKFNSQQQAAFGPGTIADVIRNLRSMPEPIPPERDVFIRPGGRFFLTSDMTNARNKDLYALCMSRGAFKEAEIGAVALQLLT